MNTDYSAWMLIVNASFVVKAVMFVLLLFSIISWGFIFERYFVLRRAKRSLRAFRERLDGGADFDKLYEYSVAKKNYATGFELVIREGFQEFSKLFHAGCTDKRALIENASAAMSNAIAREQTSLESKLPFLASAGSISPYIGLFGTVWGIMTSLSDLSTVAHATVSMVAPGISEALIATAMGLIVAIPAWLAYNRFLAAVEYIISEYEVMMGSCLVFLRRKTFIAQQTKGKAAIYDKV